MKLGKIKISDAYFKKGCVFDLLPIMSKIVPIHVEIRPHMADYVYTAVCEDFEDMSGLPEGTNIPYYSCNVKQEDNKNIEVKFKKENP